MIKRNGVAGATAKFWLTTALMFGASMMRPRAEELQTIVARGRLDRAVAVLQRLDTAVDNYRRTACKRKEYPTPMK